MAYKQIIFGSTLALSFFATSFVFIQPASASKFCAYYASTSYRVVADGKATARRMSTACRRAKRRCEREYRRKKRRNEIPRNTRRCHRVTR